MEALYTGNILELKPANLPHSLHKDFEIPPADISAGLWIFADTK
jgi:hypothetical protein